MVDRRRLFGVVAAVVGLAGATLTLAQLGKPPLTIVSWGGAFTKSQMMLSDNVKWDPVSLDPPDAVAGTQLYAQLRWYDLDRGGQPDVDAITAFTVGSRIKF